MLPKLKKKMNSSGVGIIILNENSLHMSHYGRINPHVFFTKDLQQYRVYNDFLNMHVSLVGVLNQLNSDEVSRAEELVKARNRKNEKSRTNYHAQRAAAKDEFLRAVAKDLDEKWTCDVCKYCSYQFPCLLGPTF